MISTEKVLLEMLATQLGKYPASTAIILGEGDPSPAVPWEKFNSVRILDTRRQPVVIPRLEPSDLLVVNLILEKMGCDFFVNVIDRVKPQFVCCSFYMENSSGITEEILAGRLLQKSYNLFSRNEISLSNGKTLIHLDFMVSSHVFGTREPSRFSYKVASRELMSLSVYNVGFQKCEANYQWGPGVRDHYVIHYVVSGCGRIETLDKEFSLKEGDCFICYPGTQIMYRADARDPWEYEWIGFAGADASVILNSTDFTRDAPFVRSVANGRKVRDKIREIYDARGRGFSNSIRMTGLLHELLACFVDESSSRKTHNSAAREYVRMAVDYMMENYSYPISIEDVASYVGISRSQMFRCFESVLGISPKEYLTDYRIKQACTMLESTSLNITAIANSLGFESSLYFSRAFHKALSMSPSEYRKNSVDQESGK
ncbi:MAG: AraC family transcriptional regulator [Treponema sp.]|nr:AraC family transcriptional regulator [Treponema sp.]